MFLKVKFPALLTVPLFFLFLLLRMSHTHFFFLSSSDEAFGGWLFALLSVLVDAYKGR